MATRSYDLDGHQVTVPNADKVLFPAAGVTKADLADYYCRIAKVALPHYRDRPLTMHRFPDGIDGDHFFQKHMPGHFPRWIASATLPKEDGTVRHVVANDAATLVYLAGQACLTPHLGLARVDRPAHPDRLVFDLDPSDNDFGKVRQVAGALKDALVRRGLPSFVQTTGSRGLHVVLSLDRGAGFDALRGFVRRLARSVVDAVPDLATVEQRKAARGDRVLIDIFRNAYGQTAVAPYAVRARPEAPVATPLRWDEALAPDMAPRKYTTGSIFRRLAQLDDPWRDIAADPLDARRLADEGA